MAVPLAALGLALVAGAVVAVAASTRFPVGPFKVFEPAPGLHVDIAVLGLALALLVLLPLTLVAVSALRSVRIHGGIAAGRTARPSRLAALVGRTSRSPSAAAAVRLTVEPGEGRSFVPTRSMLVSVALTVTVLVTVLVFGSNLSALDRDPSRFGWPADGVFASDGGDLGSVIGCDDSSGGCGGDAGCEDSSCVSSPRLRFPGGRLLLFTGFIALAMRRRKP